MTIEERFKAAEAAVVSLTAERDDLRKTVEASVVDVSAELEALKVESAVKDSSIASLTEALKASEDELAAANAKNAELEASKSTASAEAAVILASSGVAPVAAPVAQAVVGSICEQYAAMPVGAERRAFFKKHKAVLFSAK
jgi:chromosome segregation ATPase